MLDYKLLSQRLYKVLGMKNEAVGIKLLKNNEVIEGYDKEKKFTFCQFIMKAREGNKLLADSENIACANGCSALGFIPVPEKLLSGEFLSNLGNFEKEGAKVTMEQMPRFKQNEFTGIALSPLSKVDFNPDIIVLETVPEHLMWLSLAAIYKEGGRLNFSSSISNGTCVDMTVVPYQTKKLNVSLGCYGCRNATSIPDEHLLAGFPGEQLEGIIDSLEKISEKAMPRTREKRAYARLK
ncbi:DUF169 domain-containing protein [Anaerovorax odorimutans]|uniref:DUF169 domain-containing protein n=1 Tax=Anaerovorax odorimutans TaxID=109327 RepID=UPI00040681B6|nr:DUF169 domain-containing protein [Anaerovorax odorimutans]